MVHQGHLKDEQVTYFLFTKVWKCEISHIFMLWNIWIEKHLLYMDLEKNVSDSISENITQNTMFTSIHFNAP